MTPPLRVQFIGQAVTHENLAGCVSEGLSSRQIAGRLACNYHYIDQLKRVLRDIDARGTDDFLEPLTEPPEGGKMHTRHLRSDYTFKPLDRLVPWDGTWPDPWLEQRTEGSPEDEA